MSIQRKKTHTVLFDPRVWVLLIAFVLFVIVARSFFMKDASQKATPAEPAVFVFFRQEVKPADMPSLLRSFGADTCELIGGGTHVFQCTGIKDPQAVLKKAQESETVFDALSQEAISQ